MSRWFPDTLSLTLRVPASSVADEAPRWAGAVDAFERRVDELVARPRTRLHCALPAEFVRFAIVPWNDDFASRSTREGFVRHCFENVHGPASRDWTIRHSQSRHGVAALACAVDTALLDRLAAVAETRRLVLRQVQPGLMHAYNRDRRELPQGLHWFVLPEGACLSLLLMDGDEPRQVRMLRAPLSRLDALLLREWNALGHDAPMCPVHVARPVDETPDRLVAIPTEAVTA